MDLLEQLRHARADLAERRALLGTAVAHRQHARARLQVLGADLQPHGHALQMQGLWYGQGFGSFITRQSQLSPRAHASLHGDTALQLEAAALILLWVPGGAGSQNPKSNPKKTLDPKRTLTSQWLYFHPGR